MNFVNRTFLTENLQVNIGSALVGLSFTVAVWPLLIVFKAGRAKSNLGKYSYVLKFIGEIQIAVLIDYCND